ncbi:hypothetical protein CP967_32015 [Streptomyces nitrosporeus]|uniref:Secreted protein n=1 Tax=Streptomyces nitrosporeus TaxID=28894 RepID=A0A5J6FIE8_9ACTN|nr:hypothetical protein [Streptomyces nitrosporeus]QEU75983.1 hypothetical protein CP967_32015 [Streptomyces nitrosporeus]GGZ24250.1 hypothetical protein GCM10010327_63910 [Streptomyces nitrosporeus]
MNLHVGPRTGGTRGRAALRGAGAVLAAGLVLAAATACDGTSGGSGGGQAAKEWKAGDCAGPEKGSKDGYLSMECDDPGATIKALEVQDGSFFADSVQCPAGTDAIISVKVSFGTGDAGGGIPSRTVCGRNLSGDHPGDAGAGGGQLVVGDCVDDSAKEVPCASGGGGKVAALTETAEECPSGSEPLELFPSPGRPYDAICTIRA